MFPRKISNHWVHQGMPANALCISARRFILILLEPVKLLTHTTFPPISATALQLVFNPSRYCELFKPELHPLQQVQSFD